MSAKPLKAIIWDLDGTLIHFKIDFLRARREAIKILKNYKIPRKVLSVKRSILDNVKEARAILESRNYKIEEINRIMGKVNQSVIKIEYEAALEAENIDGIDKVLEFCHKNKLKQAVYTYNTHDNAKLSLKTVGLAHYFILIAGRDNVKNAKPHPDHINHILQELDVGPDEIFVIGDTSRDIEGAKNVGSRSIAINTKISHYMKKEMFQQADFMIEETQIPEKLIAIIERFL